MPLGGKNEHQIAAWPKFHELGTHQGDISYYVLMPHYAGFMLT